MISSPIIPAIIPTSVDDIAQFLAKLPKVPELHLDVVDGVFVPTVSWPYQPQGVPLEVATMLSVCTLEVDLMVAESRSAAQAWIAAGADLLVFHVETASLEVVREIGTTTSVTIGVAANNDTPFEILASYLPYVDYVQVMGIAEIGAQGQLFDERALTRIAEIRAVVPTMHISLDGSVNATTLPDVLTLDLQRYIMGSAIYRADDPLGAYISFSQIASAQGGRSRTATVGIL